MILVVSNVADEAANELVGMLPKGAASLVTASDLTQSFKACVSVGDFPSSEIILGGKAVRAGEISGVVTTIPRFLPQEFYYIEPADRDYVCAEVSAFFIYFLSELRCPKLNPPSARRLSGPGMHRVEWLKVADACGVPAWPFRLRNGELAPEEGRGLRSVRSTVVGGAVLGDGAPESVREHVRSLSRALSMPYLSCVFISPGGGDYFLAELDTVPDASVRENREAMLGFLGMGAPR